MPLESAPPRPPAPPAQPGDRPRADIVVDADGLLCPEPIVRLAAAIRQARVGQLIEISATDPGMLADAPAWAHVTRHEILGQRSEGERHIFWIRKVHD